MTTAWQSATSAVSSPARSAPNSSPTFWPAATRPASSPAASLGVITGNCNSRGLAVVANTTFRSAAASATLENTFAPSKGQSAPEAEAQARSCGQPSRGLTSRNSSRPKLAITRATAPMFSASCGADRIMVGAGAELTVIWAFSVLWDAGRKAFARIWSISPHASPTSPGRRRPAWRL